MRRPALIALFAGAAALVGVGYAVGRSGWAPPFRGGTAHAPPDSALVLEDLQLTGAMDKNQIANALEAHRDDLDGCYRATRGDEPPHGKLVLRLELDRTGKVMSATTLKGVFADDLATCLAEASKHWLLPSPGSSEAWVNATFSLETGVRAHARVYFDDGRDPLPTPEQFQQRQQLP